MFDAFNPDIKISLAEGKSWAYDTTQLAQIKAIDGVTGVSLSLEEIALFEYDGTQKIGTIKGVDDNYRHVTQIDTTVIAGKFETYNGGIHYGVVGMGLNGMLGVNHRDAITPITVYMLKRKQRGPLDKAFRSKTLYPSGVFSVRGEADMKYLVTSLSFVNSLLNLQEHVSTIEVGIAADASQKAVRKAIAEMMGDQYVIKDKYEQNATFLKIMNIEKWVSYLIICLTMLLIAFNLIGALWMIALDKARDITILQSIGMTSTDIKSIYRRLGLLMTGLGIFIGLSLALILYLLQKRVGLLHVPDGFMMTAYPIELNIWDFVLVPATVFLIGYLATVLPSRVAGRQQISLR